MALRQKAGCLLRVIKNLIIFLVRSVSTAINYIHKNFRHLSKYLAGKKLIVFVLVLLLGFIIVSFAAILPDTHVFESNLIVEEMSFIYANQEPQPFVKSIRQISNLEIEGKQSLTLTGKFTSQSLPQVNQLNTLKIELIDSRSKLIITPVNSKVTSEIDLEELRLQYNTQITGLSYDSYRNRLKFSVQPQPTSELDKQPNTLQLYLGEQPLKVTLEGYKLSNLKLPNNQVPLEFNLNPDNKQLSFKFSDNNTIYLTTSKRPNDSDEPWFRRKINTKNVTFEREEKGSDIRDNLVISTILEGKVRMAEQEREIKPNQFLMGEKPDEPLNIELIRNLKILPKKGLEVRVTGKTKQIKIGLDKDFPVSNIQGSRLDSILPRDAVIALFSFAAGTITSLLSYVIENASKSNSN